MTTILLDKLQTLLLCTKDVVVFLVNRFLRSAIVLVVSVASVLSLFVISLSIKLYEVLVFFVHLKFIGLSLILLGVELSE